MTAGDTKTGRSVNFRQAGEEMMLALSLLTRLPLPAFEKRSSATIASAFWAYPFAGAIIGLCAAFAYWSAMQAGFNTIVSVILATTVLLVLGGSFHEDGLSDFWDGLGGGKSREEKLEIMRDSRIGSYGVLALLLMLALHFAFLVNLRHYAGATTVCAALIAMEAIARGAIAVPIIFLEPARADGLGASMTDLHFGNLVAGGAIAAAVSVIALGSAALAFVLGAVIGAGAVTALAWHYLGGFTGDVLGAAAVTGRITALGALVLAVTP